MHVKRYYTGTILSGGFGAAPDGPKDEIVRYDGIYCVAVCSRPCTGVCGIGTVFGIGDPAFEGAGEVYGEGLKIDSDAAFD